MLGCLALLIAACSIVLVPNHFRTALAAISLPMAAAAASSWIGFGHAETPVVIAFAGSLVFWLLAKPALIAFQDSWLMADPRMTEAQVIAWRERKKCGWSLPTTAEAAQIVSRYLTYDALVGFPGVWIAPSSLSKRLFSCGFLTGCILVLATGTSANWADFRLSAAVFSLALSILSLAAMTIWAMGQACWLSSECEKQLQCDARTLFEQRVERLRNSEHVSKDVITGASIKEAEHLFLGAEPWQQFPILLHQSMLSEHVYIAGRTGSGKTSMALMLMLIQLIRGYRASASSWSEKSPVVIVDLKGDKTMFQTAKVEAEARGQKFRFFTLEPGKSSFHFNPFLAFKSGSLTLPQLVQSLLDACGLYHGDEYGKQYFSERHRNLLANALESSSNVDDFRKLHRRIKALYGNNQKEFSDGFELVSVMSGLTHYDQLITDAAQEQGNETIRLDRVLADREVVYFWLPTVKESVAANRVAKFVLFCLRAAACDRESAGEQMRQAYLLIDEFQKVAGDNFQGILQQARSAGIAAILANQSLADLKGSTWDLTSTIRTNTRTKLFFSVTEPEEAQAFCELAGEELQTFGVNDLEEIRSRLSLRDLASLSDHPKRLLLQVTSGSGYTQFGGLPIPVQTDWPISKELSDKRAAMSWPSEPRVTVSVPSPAKPSTKKSPPAAPVANAIPSTPASPKLVPAPAVKAAFAKTIKNLMDE
jgi:hypothetical protein